MYTRVSFCAYALMCANAWGSQKRVLSSLDLSYSQLWAGAENWAVREQCLSRCSSAVRRGHDQGNSYTRKILIRGFLTVSEAPGSDVLPGKHLHALWSTWWHYFHIWDLVPILEFSSIFTFSSIHKFWSSKMRLQEHSEHLSNKETTWETWWRPVKGEKAHKDKQIRRAHLRSCPVSLPHVSLCGCFLVCCILWD